MGPGLADTGATATPQGFGPVAICSAMDRLSYLLKAIGRLVLWHCEKVLEGLAPNCSGQARACVDMQRGGYSENGTAKPREPARVECATCATQTQILSASTAEVFPPATPCKVDVCALGDGMHQSSSGQARFAAAPLLLAIWVLFLLCVRPLVDSWDALGVSIGFA